MKDKKRVLIFDYDGTIADSTKIVFDAYNKIVKKYGLKKLEKVEELGKLYEKNVFQSLLSLGLSKEKLGRFFMDWREPYLENFDKIKAFNGMKEVIENLEKENILIIITSNYRDAIEKSLNKLGIRVSEIYGGEKEKSKVVKIGWIKEKYPDKDIYYIGDTKGDMSEAKEAGVPSIGVTWGLHSKKLLEEAKPNYIVNKPLELIKIFKS